MAKDRNQDQVVIENATIMFRNFAGKPDKYNRDGNRNFACRLDDDKVVKQLLEDGWNVKYLKPREEDDEPTPYIQINVRFDIRPPKIVMIAGNSRTYLDEESVETLDYVDILTVDLVFTPYRWTVGEETGIKAYLKSLFITIDQDPLEQKYENLG